MYRSWEDDLEESIFPILKAPARSGRGHFSRETDERPREINKGYRKGQPIQARSRKRKRKEVGKGGNDAGRFETLTQPGIEKLLYSLRKAELNVRPDFVQRKAQEILDRMRGKKSK